MAGISNPFAKKEQVDSVVVPKLSGFERLPADYVAMCKRIGKMWHRSPQNRQVRALADKLMARQRASQ